MSCSESQSEVTGTKSSGTQQWMDWEDGATGAVWGAVGAVRVNTTRTLARADGKEDACWTPPGTHGINERNLAMLARAREQSSFPFRDQEPILKGDEHSSTVRARGQNDLADLGSEPYLT